MNDNLPARPLSGPAWNPAPQPVSAPVQAYPQTMANSHVVVAKANGAHVAVAWVFTVISFGYFLPWAIAATRGKSNALAIGLVNFLAGWTVIGWVAALVMACMAEAVQVTNFAYAAAPIQPARPLQPPAGWYPDATGMRRYWDGARWTDNLAP